MEYDVYYSTGGLNMIGGGADVWVNKWLEMIPQHLKTESKLLIHRTRPPGHQPDCPMEVHWQGHDRKKYIFYTDIIHHTFLLQKTKIKYIVLEYIVQSLKM
jgi:hypothetical protein